MDILSITNTKGDFKLNVAKVRNHVGVQWWLRDLVQLSTSYASPVPKFAGCLENQLHSGRFLRFCGDECKSDHNVDVNGKLCDKTPNAGTRLLFYVYIGNDHYISHLVIQLRLTRSRVSLWQDNLLGIWNDKKNNEYVVISIGKDDSSRKKKMNLHILYHSCSQLMIFTT